jgi:hypothetical protein
MTSSLRVVDVPQCSRSRLVRRVDRGGSEEGRRCEAGKEEEMHRSDHGAGLKALLSGSRCGGARRSCAREGRVRLEGTEQWVVGERERSRAVVSAFSISSAKTPQSCLGGGEEGKNQALPAISRKGVHFVRLCVCLRALGVVRVGHRATKGRQVSQGKPSERLV